MISDCCGNPQVIAGLTTFTPTIPKFYWDVDSQEQGIHQLCKTVCMVIDYLNQVADQVNLDTDAIAKLEADFKAFVEHGFDDYYREQIEKWFEANAWQIYKLLAKQVFFGLTDDGYFCAYVPDSWAEITFDTGAVFGRSDYGRLCLKFDAIGEGVIDNTYGYSLNESGYNPTDIDTINAKLDSLVADLEITTRRGDSAFATLFTNLDKEVSKGGDNV